jgi:hypothetical protein
LFGYYQKKNPGDFKMKGKAVIILLISIASISVSELLFQLNLLDKNYSSLLWLISISFFLYAFFSLLKDFEFESKYFKVILYIFLFYQFVTIIRGFSFSYDSLKTIFREAPIFWPFIIPLFVFFDKRFFNLVSLFKTLYGFGLFFLILNLCFPTLLIVRLLAQNIIPAFALGCGFLLMNAKYLSNKKVNISFLVIILSALSYTFLARRSAAFTLYGFLISGYLLNTLNKSRKLIFKLFPLMIGIGVFLFFYPNKFSSALTNKMNERLYQDSRTGLYKVFFIQMNDFMAFGKGINGTYYYPMDESIQDDGIIYNEASFRNVIENGYLQLLLTGGIMHIILFVLVLLPAAIIGILRSHNQFTRSCGVMVLLWLLDMILYGLPTLSMHYIIIWICVGICYKATLRNKTDDEIMDEFKKYNLN